MVGTKLLDNIALLTALESKITKTRHHTILFLKKKKKKRKKL